jgi:hypothetical protein
MNTEALGLAIIIGTAFEQCQAIEPRKPWCLLRQLVSVGTKGTRRCIALDRFVPAKQDGNRHGRACGAMAR